jgi:hypothetical protein
MQSLIQSMPRKFGAYPHDIEDGGCLNGHRPESVTIREDGAKVCAECATMYGPHSHLRIREEFDHDHNRT